jgi:hypothetical protein
VTPEGQGFDAGAFVEREGEGEGEEVWSDERRASNAGRALRLRTTQTIFPHPSPSGNARLLVKVASSLTRGSRNFGVALTDGKCMSINLTLPPPTPRPLTAVGLPLFTDALCQCDECRTPQRRREVRAVDSIEVYFPTLCTWCGEATALVMLVPAAVSRSEGEWMVRVLGPSDAAHERDAGPGNSAAYCLTCGESQEPWDFSDPGHPEIHFATRCSACHLPTEVVAVEPFLVSRSHDRRQWYVCDIAHDEIELLRYGVDPCNDAWLS